MYKFVFFVKMLKFEFFYILKSSKLKMFRFKIFFKKNVQNVKLL
jgi:hypothetical protein